jgi:hypothetical protein
MNQNENQLTLTTQELVDQGYPLETAENHPANINNQVTGTITTEDLVSQGYPEEIAKVHPANAGSTGQTESIVSSDPSTIVRGMARAAGEIKKMQSN